MSESYADIAFPTAVRRLFTYRIPELLVLQEGMRVWVPLRSEIAIGLVVRIHSESPSFETRPAVAAVDEEPAVTQALLELTEWVHRFYYCSWGEALQAALPPGRGFWLRKVLIPAGRRPASLPSGRSAHLPETGNGSGADVSDGTGSDVTASSYGSVAEEEILADLSSREWPLSEARKRWRSGKERAALERLTGSGRIQIWEVPRKLPEEQTVKVWDWTEKTTVEELNSLREQGDYKWVEAADRLREAGLPAAQNELLKLDPVTHYTLTRLEKEGVIVALHEPVRRMIRQRGEVDSDAGVTLSQEQQSVLEPILEAVRKGEYSSFLLHGITGSGKTEVYIHALKTALEAGRGGIVLVPEIALTPQTVRRFHRIFGREVAVLHSRLNERERSEEWQRLKSGESRIAIGPRSAVFAPVRNPGLIVIDEEHDSSYKQFDPAPRYHARDVAILRALGEKAVVVMGSATPSMTSLLATRKGKHKLLTLSGRPVGELPEVKRLDLRQYRHAMQGPLTVELFQAVRNALEQQMQVILLYNRRGYASCLVCEACGHIPQSPHASVSLTYHRSRDMLLCHYSGYARKADRTCESCGGGPMRATGSGTQQVEEEIARLFPEARLLRMDRDTTTGRDAHREIYEAFLNRQADILIGTQLVSKGLDFPGVSVVGVLHAETELAFPSYRSGERTFQLLSQVAGRAGRSDRGGRVYIQTWRPEHRAIRHACLQQYEAFAREELEERKALSYPPYSRLILFRFKSRDANRIQSVASRFTEVLREVTSPGAVLGPSPSVIEKMHGLWQWESILKIRVERGAEQIETLLDRIFARYREDRPPGSGSVRIAVDVDAIE